MLQQTVMLAVKEAKESAKLEQLTRVKVEEDTLPELGTVTPLIFLFTKCTKHTLGREQYHENQSRQNVKVCRLQ